MVRERDEPGCPSTWKASQTQVRLYYLLSYRVCICVTKRLIFRPDRVKQLKEGPYTHKEANAAVGLWTDNGRPNTDMEPRADINMTT